MAYYAGLRMKQIQESLYPDSIAESLVETKLGLPFYFYSMNLFVHMSELFRHFKNDEELSGKLKSTNQQRLEFRKKVRDVAAKSLDIEEIDKTLEAFWKVTEIKWIEEFNSIISYVLECLKEISPAYSGAVAQELEELHKKVKNKPIV